MAALAGRVTKGRVGRAPTARAPARRPAVAIAGLQRIQVRAVTNTPTKGPPRAPATVPTAYEKMAIKTSASCVGVVVPPVGAPSERPSALVPKAPAATKRLGAASPVGAALPVVVGPPFRAPVASPPPARAKVVPAAAARTVSVVVPPLPSVPTVKTVMDTLGPPFAVPSTSMGLKEAPVRPGAPTSPVPPLEPFAAAPPPALTTTVAAPRALAVAPRPPVACPLAEPIREANADPGPGQEDGPLRHLGP